MFVVPRIVPETFALLVWFSFSLLLLHAYPSLLERWTSFLSQEDSVLFVLLPNFVGLVVDEGRLKLRVQLQATGGPKPVIEGLSNFRLELLSGIEAGAYDATQHRVRGVHDWAV